jgi:mannitol/fructose-specific phosphotransferase system IIA component (Ntr-type)
MKYYINFEYAADFDDALIKSSKEMLEYGDIDVSYLEAIYRMIEKEGCYFVLLDEIAFVHASTEFGSYNEAISVLILDEPILCEEERIKVLLLLSGKTNEGHLNLLKHIALRLKNGNDQLLKEATTKEEVIQLLF